MTFFKSVKLEEKNNWNLLSWWLVKVSVLVQIAAPWKVTANLYGTISVIVSASGDDSCDENWWSFAVVQKKPHASSKPRWAVAAVGRTLVTLAARAVRRPHMTPSLCRLPDQSGRHCLPKAPQRLGTSASAWTEMKPSTGLIA